MKKVVLVIILSIIILSVLAYYLSGVIFKNPTEILFDAIEKATKLEKVRLDYSVDVSAELGSLVVSGQGSATVTKFGDVYKTVTRFSTSSPLGGQQETTQEIYSLPEGEVSCTKVSLISQKYSCSEVEPSFDPMTTPTLSPQTQINQIKEWVEKGMVKISYLGTKQIINRRCNALKFDVDINKLFKNVTGGVSFKEGEAKFTVEVCLDEEYGVDLEAIIKFWVKEFMGSEFNMEMSFEAKEIGFDVDRSEVQLPVPMNEVRWLPKLSIESSTCEAGVNVVTIRVRARKDVPSGRATLNVTWSDYVYRTGYVTYSLTSTTTFPGAKRGETRDLSFTLPTSLNESESYTFKVTVDGFESDTDYCFASSIRFLGSVTSYIAQIIERFRNITKIF